MPAASPSTSPAATPDAAEPLRAARPVSDVPLAPRALALLTPARVGIAFILLVALARFGYLALRSPYTLAEDEAHYWEWSRNLGWSYYSKGPGVAYAIAAATRLFGDVEWAVRLPAVLFGALGALFTLLLTRDLFRGHALARPASSLAGVLFVLVPAFALASFLMTIDGPYIACFAAACAAAWRALRMRSRLAWPALALALGVGFLFKYTILLLPLGLAAYALLDRRNLRLAPRPLPWIALALLLLGLCSAPVVVFNAHHDWDTVRHLLGHLGVEGGDVALAPEETAPAYAPSWTLEYVALQHVVAGPALALAILGAVALARAGRRDAAQDADRPEQAPSVLRFCIAASASVYAFYLGVTLFTRAEANWAIAGMVPLLPLAAYAGVLSLRLRRPLLRALLNFALVIGVLTNLAFPGAPLLARLPLVGDAVPLDRLTGLRPVAAAAADLGARLREQTGREPIYMSAHYGRASQLAFYLPDHPTTYAAGHMFGGRRTQYDVWEHTDLSNPDVLARLEGRPAVLFGKNPDLWTIYFDRVEQVPDLPGEPQPHRNVYIAYGFHAPREGSAPETEAAP